MNRRAGSYLGNVLAIQKKHEKQLKEETKLIEEVKEVKHRKHKKEGRKMAKETAATRDYFDRMGQMPTGEYDRDEAAKNSTRNSFFVQYRFDGNSYVAINRTFETLKPGFYTMATQPDGLHIIPSSLTTDHLIRLPDSASDQVIEDIEKFWTLKDVFNRLGLVHKRGFLLHGPPGCGKTSTLAFLTYQMIKEGGIVLMGDVHPGVTTVALQQVREVEPNRHIMVAMEDIDTIIQSFGESPVLSLLDGESSVDNVVFIATTNFPERLQDRISKRPSRFDRVMEIGFPNRAARKLYLESKHLNLTKSEFNKWLDLTDKFSIAHLKELVVSVVCYGNNIETEAKKVRNIGNLEVDPNE